MTIIAPNRGEPLVDKQGNPTLRGAEFLEAVQRALNTIEDTDSVRVYTVSSVATSRSFNADTVTLPELADVVGTLIADIKSGGILS